MEVNKIKAIERTEQWRKNNPGHYKKYNKEYYLKNREKKLEYSNKYYWENREKALKQHKEWYKQNPEYNRNYYQKTKLACFLEI